MSGLFFHLIFIFFFISVSHKLIYHMTSLFSSGLCLVIKSVVTTRILVGIHNVIDDVRNNNVNFH